MNEVREGAVARLGILFERHHRRLYNFCLRLTGDRHLAEDLVQEVFARILKYRHTYRPDSDFLVWTYQMTRNVCADHFRRLARTAEAPGEPPIDVAGAEARPLDELESARSGSRPTTARKCWWRSATKWRRSMSASRSAATDCGGSPTPARA